MFGGVHGKNEGSGYGVFGESSLHGVHGKTTGIIGTGKIGKVIIDILRGFKMKVLAFDKFKDEKSRYFSKWRGLSCPNTVKVLYEIF